MCAFPTRCHDLSGPGRVDYAGLQMSQEGNADGSTFKKYWWRSLRWGLLVYSVGAVLLLNIWFYFNLNQSRTLFTWSNMGMLTG